MATTAALMAAGITLWTQPRIVGVVLELGVWTIYMVTRGVYWTLARPDPPSPQSTLDTEQLAAVVSRLEALETRLREHEAIGGAAAISCLETGCTPHG